MAYTNPYLNMLPSMQQTIAQQMAPLQQQANALSMMAQGQQQIPIVPQQNGDSPFVTKEEFNQLLEENRKLKEELEKELTQRSDMEFFKKEQEVLKLDEGRRAYQEVEYAKQQYFNTLWKTSPLGKDTMQKYRDTIGSIYDRYTQQPVASAQTNVAIEQPTPKVIEQAAEEQTKKYNVVNTNTVEAVQK